MATGLLIGGAQWLTMRRCTRVSAAWIWAYGAVWFGAWRLAFEYGGFFAPSELILGGIGGGVTGLLQWVTLRSVLRRAWTWIPASAVASIVGCWLGVIAGFAANDHISSDLAYPVGAAVAGLVMGLLSGAALFVLSRQSQRA
jgi:hypothetical protein